MSKKELEGRIALVTGASRGIGAAAAVELAKRGAHVVLLSRTQGGLEETDDRIRAAGGSATLVPFDLRQDDKIDPLGPSIYERFGKLDILVHAAGLLGQLSPVAHIQPRDWTEVMGVNLTSTWRLIRTTEPLLRASDAGRAVFPTPGLATQPKAYWGLYGASKAALNHLIQTWALELATTPIRVNLFDPGIVASQLRSMAMPGENPDTLTQPEDIAPAMIDLCLPGETRQGQIVTLAA